MRSATRADLSSIAAVLDEIDLFPSDLLPDMIEPFLAGGNDGQRWFVCEDAASAIIGFAFCRAEELTDGTWNLLAIGLLPARQGQGAGQALLRHVEQALDTARLLIVETSSLDEFAATRRFYDKSGYTNVACIPAYWANGDDKVIFSKRLDR